ncbi:hypothetical protein [Mycobacterium sp. AZCC_0083]|uniref:hypothetical protein n=1 Tax=Mycobacterium sp. AZCC_0083 TaxID=2735882 RepID=UPI00160ACED2|nr:hypothetical protein [Mycobacterium sp. AZCC_0083]MBB5166481.1 hypothetical protein [Mycobacterium sp. AZCC_0083]
MPKRLRHLLTEYRWVLVVAAGLMAFTLGFFGYREWLTSLHQHDPVTARLPPECSTAIPEILKSTGQRVVRMENAEHAALSAARR